MTRDETEGNAERLGDYERIKWSYEHSYKHYEADHTLLAGRMNLYLTLQPLFIAAFSLFGSPSISEQTDRRLICLLASFVCLLWLLTSLSSYAWIQRWRSLLVNQAKLLRAHGVDLTLNYFSLETEEFLHTPEGSPSNSPPRRSAWRIYWLIRPTRLAFALPFSFMAFWLYIAFST